MLTVRIGGAERTLPRAYLDRATRSGDPSIQHGYAISAYVAQGLTCRTALVLVHDDADREWAYMPKDRETLSVREAHGDLELAADRSDVPLQRGHAHFVLAFDPRDVRAARGEFGRDLLLRDAAPLTQLVERDVELEACA